MKKITIKITGSGTRKDVSKALKQIAREILALSFENHSIHTLEDDVLIAEVTEDEEEELFKRAIRVACDKFLSISEYDNFDCYIALKRACINGTGHLIMAYDVAISEDDCLPVWEGAESMNAQQMLDCIEYDVKEEGFDPDNFVTL